MKLFYNVLFLLLTVTTFAQNQLWKGYFSYNEIKAVTATPTKTYFASSNAVFVWDDVSEDLTVFNSINGFKGFNITSIAYSPNFNKIIVGNSNGQIGIIDVTSGKTTTLNDIVNKNGIPENLKYINDIYVNENTAYVATKYGISAIRLKDNNFGDSYYIGDGGAFTSVLQTTVVDKYIYAITEDFGMKRILISNPNMIDFALWETYSYAKWLSVVNLAGRVVAVKDDLSLNRFDNNVAVPVTSVYGGFLRLSVLNNELTVTTHEVVRLYDQNLAFQKEFIADETMGLFNCALVKKGIIYLGTRQNGAMLVHFNNNVKRTISPSGPSVNNAYKMLCHNNELYVIFGGLSGSFDPTYSLHGINKYNATRGWEYLKPNAISNARSTSYISVNPRKPALLYVSSSNDGLLEITQNTSNFAQSTSKLFNWENSPLGFVQDDDYKSTRVIGPEFDRNGTGWMTNNYVSNATVVRSLDLNGTWKAYSLTSVLSDQRKEKILAPVIDKNSTKWFPTNNSGVVGFNELRANKVLRIDVGDNSGNLTNAHVNSVAVDLNNQLWIGTNGGLRVLSSIDQFLNANSLKTNPIIIMDDGKAQELFYQQQIMKIKVDGANNKWVAIGDAGVFLVSPNGQETIYYFNVENSPLPSNNVNDIVINGSTGEVFFATDKGIVSFLNYATDGREDLNNVKVFPNPVRPGYSGEVKITGLETGSTVKITDVAGNLVFEQKSQGGSVLWNTYSFAGEKVVSGVYMIFISSDSGDNVAVKKVMIIR